MKRVSVSRSGVLASFSRALVGGALVLLVSAAPAWAQTARGSGRMEGTVLDPSGATVPGATLTARNQATGGTTALTSGADGHFLFLSLTPGSYQLSIEMPGFQTLIMKDLVVTVGTTTSIKPQLVMGNVETTVSVSAPSPLVDTKQSSMSSVVGQQTIQTLPLNGRDFTDFVLLTPGATTDGEFGMVSFNGVAGNYNNYTVDGANNTNAFFAQQIGRGTVPFQFSVDVIQEFQVNSTGFEAEFGQSGGGLVNTVTKAGGNQLRGGGYYYILDSALNANDAINMARDIPKPSNRRQQAGFTLGGPLVQNRLFFLGNYEGQLRNEPVTVNNAPGLATLTDPAAFFAANPSMKSIVDAASGSFPRSFNQNTAFLKLSGNLNSKTLFTLTYNYQRFLSPHGYFNTPTSTGDGLSLTDGATSHFFQFTAQTMLSPTAMNEFRIHVGNDVHFDLPDTAPTQPATIIQNPDSGFVFGGNRFQLSTTDRRYQITDNFTWVRGRHTLKAGVDINVNQDRDYFVYGPKGAYFFASLADVPGGNFEYYLQSFGESAVSITTPTYAVFAQDQFRATPRLTVNYGVRWDLQDLPQPKTCNPDVPLTCKIPVSYKNVAPRLGFAYSLDEKATTVLRGAAGLFFIQEDLLDVSQAFLSNGISRFFLFVPGPAFGNSDPIVTYPNSLTSPPAGGAGGGSSLTVFAPNFRNPYVEQANIAVEHQFGTHTALSVGYAFSHGVALLGNGNGVTRQANGNFGYDLNLVPPQLQSQFGGSFSTATVKLPNGQSYVVPEYEAIDGLLNPNFATITAVDNSGSSIYHGLLVSLRYVSSRVHGSVAYTLSRTTDQGTGYYNQFDQRAQRGPSALDQAHRLVLSGGWSPEDRWLKGFTFAAVASLASGRPYTAVFDDSHVNFSMVPGEGFNSFRGPGIANLDVSVTRAIRVSRRVAVTAKVEAFDLLNHANYQQNSVDNLQYTTSQRCGASDSEGNCLQPLPIWDVTGTNPDFGKPSAIAPKYGSRSFQFSARVSF
jgi:Carboxypeptidase regulatory-like domain